MAQQIIGVDLGAYSIKAVVLTVKPRLQAVRWDEEPIVEPSSPAPEPSPAQPQADSRESAWEDTPQADEAPTQERGALASDDSASDQEPPLDAQDPQSASQAQDDQEAQDGQEAMAPWLAALSRLIARMDLGQAESLVVFMPGNRAMTIMLKELPFAERQQLIKIMPGLLQDRLPLPLDKAVHDFRPLPKTPGPHEALVAFAKREELRQSIEELARAQVNPTQIAVAEWALELAARQALPAQTQTYALLDLGHEHTRVLVMQRGQPVLARTIHLGGAQLEQAIASRFAIPIEQARQIKHLRGELLKPDQALDPSLAAMSEAIARALLPLVRDLRRTFQSLYARERVELEAIYLCGGTSQLKQLDRFLGEQLGVPTSALPLEALELDRGLAQGQRASLVMAYSLALALSPAGKGVALNLRQGAFAYRGRSSFLRAQGVKFAAIAVVLLALLISALVMQQRDLSARKEAMRDSVAKETKRVLGTSVYDKKTLDRLLDADAQDQASIAPKMSAYRLMYEIVSRVGEDTKLDLQRLEVNAGNNLIQIYGTTTNAQMVDKLVSDLERLECLKEIRKDKLKVVSEDKASFELQITSGCS